MLKCWINLLVLLFFVAFSQAQINFPLTEKSAQTDNYHGVNIADPYRWLENDSSAATKKWITEESKITDAYLESIPFRHQLRNRMAAYYNYARYTTPVKRGDYYYFSRNDGLQNYSVIYRQSGIDGEPKPILDPNKFSQDGSIQLADFVPSADGKFAAWGISRAGSDWETFFVRDMMTGKDLADTVRWIKVSEIAWQKDGFYYSRYPEPATGQEYSSTNQDQQLWYHKIGSKQSDDQLVFRDSLNPYRFYFASTSEDERYVFLSVLDRLSGFTGNALYFLDSQKKELGFRPIKKEITNYSYGVVDPVGRDSFLIYTNENAANSRIMLFDAAKYAGNEWSVVVPEKNDPLESASLAGEQLFLKYLKTVAADVVVYTTKGKLLKKITLPGPGSVDGFEGAKNDSVVFYSYQSLNFPLHIFKYNIPTGESSIYRKPLIVFDPASYITTRLFAKSKDGTLVPMLLVHKKGLKKNGRNPTLMYAYGGFNYSVTPKFNNEIMPWLEQGGIYVQVNTRGGGEFGEKWHQDGMLEKKQNVFDDFIAAAEFLIKQKYTSSPWLAMKGASNGGLLVASVMNQRPQLFKVAIPDVGVMDMLRFQKFTIGWNWTSEYGNSDNEKDFANLIKYSPLHNISAGKKYPATMVITADHDDRVVPAHSFKYIATLQEKYKGKNPVLLKIENDAGHGLSSIMKNIELAADIYSFILFNLGVNFKESETGKDLKTE